MYAEAFSDLSLSSRYATHIMNDEKSNLLEDSENQSMFSETSEHLKKNSFRSKISIVLIFLFIFVFMVFVGPMAGSFQNEGLDTTENVFEIFASASYCDRIESRTLPTTLLLTLQDTNISFPVTSSNSMAVQYFNEGLALFYSFNGEEAVRYFRKALTLDPLLTMAYFGLALAVGTNINIHIDSKCETYAVDQLTYALQHMNHLSPLEQQLINALAARHSLISHKQAQSLFKLQSNTATTSQSAPLPAELYRDCMSAVFHDHPLNGDVAAIYTDSLMDLIPFAMWTAEGTASDPALTDEILRVLDLGLKASPRHIGLHHFNIHAHEGSSSPHTALVSADYFMGVNLTAGHLVHMPAHIYQRLGMYSQATLSNQRAYKIDSQVLSECAKDITSDDCDPIYAGYYTAHNLLFLATTFTLMRRQSDALYAAREIDRLIPHYIGRGQPHLEHYLATTVLTLERFGLWNEVLAMSLPVSGEVRRKVTTSGRYLKSIPSHHNDNNNKPSYIKVRLAFHHWCRAKAFLGLKQINEARTEQALFLSYVSQITPIDSRAWGAVTALDLCTVAALELQAKLVYIENNDTTTAIKYLTQAVSLQDTFPYDEPIVWLPVRIKLGAMYYLSGNFTEGRKQFTDDLYGVDRVNEVTQKLDQRTTPRNVMSLYGVYMCNLALKVVDVEGDKLRFDQEWRESDGGSVSGTGSMVMSDLL